MLPLILGALAARAIHLLQTQGAGSPANPAIAVPQVHRPGGPTNAVAAPSLAIPFASPVTRTPGPIPSSAGLPVSGPQIPPLSGLTDMPFVAGIPDPEAVQAVQINPRPNAIQYGRTFAGGRSSAFPGT
jgi:hypothetical protein